MSNSAPPEGLRRKPWFVRRAACDGLPELMRGIAAAGTELEQAEHRHVAQARDDAMDLAGESGERLDMLRETLGDCVLRKGNFPDVWGAYAAGTLYLDQLLLNPENRLELLRTLLFLSGSALGETDEVNEGFAAEVTRAQRLPHPERRPQSAEEAIAAGRDLWRDDVTLAPLGRVAAETFESLLQLLAPRLYANRLLLNELRRSQLDLLPRLARLPGFHFDLARETLGQLFARFRAPVDTGQLDAELRELLLPELIQRVREALIWDLLLNRQSVATLLANVTSTDMLREVARSLVRDERGAEGEARFAAIETSIADWLQGITTYAENYARLSARLDDAQRLATALIEAAAAHGRAPELPPEPLEQPLHWLFPRIYQVPHLKSLDKPMLVLLAGIPLGGSRFVSKRLARELSIRTFFTTNQVREAIRSTVRWTYGEQTAGALYPELFGSILEPLPPEAPEPEDGGLASFYVQALFTLQGLQGALKRLVKENSSAIVEGVHIVPGMIDEQLYRRANIVTLILGYAETPELLPAGVRDEPERIERRAAMARRINERVLDLAHRAEITVVHDPGRFEATMGEILHRAHDTVADRHLAPADPLLEATRDILAARRRQIYRESVHTPSAATQEKPPQDPFTLARLAAQRATLGDLSAPEADRLNAAAALERILSRVHDPVALVFDMGGVLVRGHNAIFTRRYAAERLGVELDEAQLEHIHQAVFKVNDAPYRRTTRGEAEPRAFARHLLAEIMACRPPKSTAAPADIDDEVQQRQLLQSYYDHYEEIAENTRGIARLRELGIPVYGLTNNFIDKVSSIQRRIPLIRDLPMVISDVARARKPQRGIFHNLVRLLQLTRGADLDDMQRVLFFDDKRKNLNGGYRHFGFYGVDYDANRGERLDETPELREILGGELLRETRDQVRQLLAEPDAHAVGPALAATLDNLERSLTRLQRGTSTAPEPEPGEAKVRRRLLSLGLKRPSGQTPLVDFTLGAASRAFLARHRDLLLRTRSSLVALRTLQYQLLSHMVNVPDGDYDPARRELGQVVRHIDEYTSPAEVEQRLLRALFGELKWFLTDYLAERGAVDRSKLERCLSGITDYRAFKEHQCAGFRKLLGGEPLDAATLMQIDSVVAHIEEGVEDTARKYLQLWTRWYIDRLGEMGAVMEDDSVRKLVHELSPHAWHAFVRWLYPRAARIPRIKNLNRPTVVLIAGTSGTGKSSVARHIARSLAIPMYFSTDVLAREVVRSTLGFLLGRDAAQRAFPELYSSSFALPEQRLRAAQAGGDAAQSLVDWYYGHASLTMIGVRGILDRLLATDNSAVIEGVPLVPGFLPERYFERLNLVWVVTSIEDEETHFERYAGRDQAGVDRGGAARYRKRFDEIRLIHDRLATLGRRADCTVVDNTYGLGETAELALDRIENVNAARGLPVADPDRERVREEIEARRRRIWSERLLGWTGMGEPEEPLPPTG